ncbi:MAG: beta-eliminating lyase-related protein [Atopobiaceae bacterium]|nr:beta-eliminating lyase-related protein [Atopobiaceae bacterium]
MGYVSFASDYQQGCHPAILRRMVEGNMECHAGYGADDVCESARGRIREACACPSAAVHFLAGGTQANMVVLDALLAPWEGVVAATSGHVSVHEAGAIEHGGHKVIELSGELGKLTAKKVEACAASWETDDNRDHMVQPGVVYISQPSEYGTLYSRMELEAISHVCHEHGMRLYVDGARLAYALGCPANDVTLPDLARLADAFYIGGTKCGALLGEAVVFPNPAICPRFFTQMKQHGALLAKSWLVGMQFDVLFEGELYEQVGRAAIVAADRMRELLAAQGYRLVFGSPTNQIFVELSDDGVSRLAERVGYSFWEKSDTDHAIVRLATSWATTEADLDALAAALDEIGH